jgi:nicotinamidase-related amidase
MGSKEARRCLLIVDMSVEQLADLEYKKQEIIQNVLRLGQCKEFFDLLIDCRLWLNGPEESSLSWSYPESGRSLFVAGSSGAALIPELQSGLRNLLFVAKNNFSCFAKSNMLQVLRQETINDIYIVGINTDFCVFATALDAFQHMFRTYVVKDAVSSVRGKAAHEEGLRNLERHFGKQVLVETVDIAG